MCSSVAPRFFNLGRPISSGAGVTTQPATTYASSTNPSLTDAGAATPATPNLPQAPKPPGATNLGQNNAQTSNPFLLAISQMGGTG